MIRRALVVLLMALPAAPVLADGSDAATFGAAFCAAAQADDFTAIEAQLTADLRDLLDAAWAGNAASQKANPGDKPPLGDGIPWRSYPDAIDSCTPGAATATDGETTLPVAYGFTDAPDAGFSDTLVLHASPGDATQALLLDDVRFSVGGTLREALSAAANP